MTTSAKGIGVTEYFGMLSLFVLWTACVISTIFMRRVANSVDAIRHDAACVRSFLLLTSVVRSEHTEQETNAKDQERKDEPGIN